VYLGWRSGLRRTHTLHTGPSCVRCSAMVLQWRDRVGRARGERWAEHRGSLCWEEAAVTIVRIV
jgi:hypothetical protein